MLWRAAVGQKREAPRAGAAGRNSIRRVFHTCGAAAPQVAFMQCGDLSHATASGAIRCGDPGMKGTYQHCSEKHLHRYLAEFDFRYNNRIKLGVDDEMRTMKMVKGAQGKRLTYRTTDRDRSGVQAAGVQAC